MTKVTTAFIGLDVHKDSIAIAVAEDGRQGEILSLGIIPHDEVSVKKSIKKLSTKYKDLNFCYEAGPCGYGLYRLLKELEHSCDVVAPSLIPKRPGDRVKTDRRDAIELAKLHRSGDLTSVWVPDEDHEAMRDLVRLRYVAVEEYRKARQQLLSFLLRHGKTYKGKQNWTKTHFRWLRALKFNNRKNFIVLQEHLHHIEDAKNRLENYEQHIIDHLSDWSLANYVEAFQVMRGIGFISASILQAEIGDITRFASAEQLMAYVGIIPREHSSGSRIRRGGITKTGNREVRRVIIECAWSYHFPARVSEQIYERIEGHSKDIRDIAWKAQVRLSKRYMHLKNQGKHPNTVVTAVAREMLGFIWCIACQVKRETMQA